MKSSKVNIFIIKACREQKNIFQIFRLTIFFPEILDSRFVPSGRLLKTQHKCRLYLFHLAVLSRLFNKELLLFLKALKCV